MLLVLDPFAMSLWVAVNDRPGDAVSQVNVLGGMNSVTVQSREGWPGCLIRAMHPSPKGWSSRRVIEVTVGVHSGQRSRSRVTDQTRSGDASITFSFS
jgi:hypothetical protein